MNLERLVKELRRPDTLLAQLEMSVDLAGEPGIVPGSGPDAPAETSPAEGAVGTADETEGAGVTAARGAPAPAGGSDA